MPSPAGAGREVPPPRSASFAAKMDYYRSQHSTRGIRATHLVGIPGVAFSIPLLVARPKVGVPAFGLSWALQVLGHTVFERNSPALTKGFFTYQLCGLAFWCEEVADLIAGRGLAGAPAPEIADQVTEPAPELAAG
jgi:uncharacterized membrane protein YGL010W